MYGSGVANVVNVIDGDVTKVSVPAILVAVNVLEAKIVSEFVTFDLTVTVTLFTPAVLLITSIVAPWSIVYSLVSWNLTLLDGGDGVPEYAAADVPSASTLALILKVRN